MSIDYKKRDGVAYITLNNPAKANILDKETSDEISEAWTDLWEDRSIRCAILTGKGDKHFCGGHNLAKRKNITEEEREYLRTQRIFWPLGGTVHGQKTGVDGRFGDHYPRVWKPVIAAVNALGSAGNAVSGGINSAISFFGGGSHSIPSIPSIPSTDFPVIDLFSYVGYLDDVQAAAGQCGLFTNLFYEMAFPIRSLMNDRVCPIVRYTANSIAYAPLNFVLGLFFFDAAPDGNNCADPGLWWTCFWLNFGSLLMYIVAPLQIAYALYPALKKLLQDGWQWVVILLKLAVTVVVKCMHSLHKQKKARKKIN